MNKFSARLLSVLLVLALFLALAACGKKPASDTGTDGASVVSTTVTTAVTRACYITEVDANKVTYRSNEIADHFDEIAKSVNNVVKNSYTITPCSK